MSMTEYEDAFVFRCDGGCGLTCEFERGGPGSFMACVGEIKDRGWRIDRDRYGDFGHKCASCWRKGNEGILDRPLRRVQ